MNLMSTRTSAFCLTLAAVLGSPVAHAELTANVAATSNYVWRGLTQTDDGAALQAGIDYAHDSGLYAGAWASNVDFPDAEIEGIEYDLYAGFANTIGEEFGYDIGYLGYNYTDSDADYASEIKLGISYGPAALNHYIGDIDAPGDNEYTYDELNLEFEMGEVATLSLHYGVTDPDAAGADNVADYSVSVGKDFSGFNVSLSVADNDDESNEEDTLVFVTVKKDFEL